MSKCLFLLISITASFLINAKPLTINVLTADNQGLANAVVYLTSKKDQSDGIANTMSIMDQVNTQFLPHILAIQKGSQVRFPNSDSIKHHVYSFSPTKTFELQLYKELESDPLLFSKPGVVAVGCNIHDWMLGYILVVDTPYFKKTDIDGHVSLELPDGEYQLDVWHPRIQDKLSSLSRLITISDASEIDITLASPLSPDLSKYEDTSDEFSDYE